MRRLPVAVIVGTRPEAIKMAPVCFELARSRHLRPVLISTGQHREMLQQALAAFDLVPDRDLKLMRRGQSLPDLTARLVTRLAPVLRRFRPAAALVQGDTTTTLAAALVAYYEGIPVGHVEAGLRTFDPRAPFPEEMNRRLADHLSRWCFAPTPLAGDRLRAEGISGTSILVTGNTVVDALLWIRRNRKPGWPVGCPEPAADRRLILVTIHRRESFGEPMRGLFKTLRRLTEAHPDLEIVYPVHRNPEVRKDAYRILDRAARIHLIEPVDYPELVALLDRAYLVLTDSGGIQEEAPTFGKPVLVLRAATERPEGVEQGTSLLVGTDPERLLSACRRLLTNRAAYRRMALRKNPFGDGRAARRIVARLERDLKGD